MIMSSPVQIQKGQIAPSISSSSAVPSASDDAAYSGSGVWRPEPLALPSPMALPL